MFLGTHQIVLFWVIFNPVVQQLLQEATQEYSLFMVLPWRREGKLISICFRIIMWMESFFGYSFLLVNVGVRYQPQNLWYCAHRCRIPPSKPSLPCTLHPFHPVSEWILPLEWLLPTLLPRAYSFILALCASQPCPSSGSACALFSCLRMTLFGLGVGLQNYHCPFLRPLYADTICRWYHFNGRKWRGTKEPLEGERGEKAGSELKT